MVFDIILPILVQLITDPVNKYVVAPTKRHVGYAFKCDSSVQRLKEQVEQLQNKKDRLQQSVDDATRNGDSIFPNVTNWLITAEKDVKEADEIIQLKDEAKNNRCFFGVCPNLKTHYLLSKISEKKALAIDKLCNEEGLDSISFQLPLQQIVEPSLYSREALPSRVLMLNRVMDALRDPNLNTIGVFGMGGVGKTTLAKEVQAKALQEKRFEAVVMVAVSQSPELRRIQGEIADFLGMKFSAEELPGRASQLHRRLEKSKVLIILDDLWQKLDLNAVGIPSQGASEGFKTMLTSRSRDLLSSEMCAQKLFSLEALEEDETLCLFQMSIAEAKDPEFHHIATQIAKRCAGLPLLIQMVATDLMNKESYEWNNKLNQLSAFGDEEIYQKVYKVLESSYENLPGEEIKEFFLICALFGQSNIQIKYLLTHSMGLGLFKYVYTIEAARDKVYTLINKLKAKSLLSDGDMVGYVKMHDVVRDTALSIASIVQHAFIGAGEVRFTDRPNNDCTKITLPYCNVSELPVGLDCPEANLFFLFTEDLSLKIPDPFFDGMKKLKVVDFRGMRFVSFPESFGLLTNLQTLCLNKCKLGSMAVLGELRQLEYLSFANSNVVELPREVEALTRLKLLDLQGCSDLQVIHANIFSRLCSLEALYMLNSFVRWNAKGNASLAELENMNRLSTLEIQIPDPNMIPIGFKCFSQLRRYKISIGHLWDWKGEPERLRMLKLKVEAAVRLEDDTEFLLRETEDLYLDGVRGIDTMFHEGFPKLKHMHIENDNDIEHLIKSTMPASHSAFPVLESLYLKCLRRLETVCSTQLGIGSFGELRILKISHCDKLSSLFSFSALKCLQQLRELEVEFCENMKAVFGERNEDDQHHNNEGIELTQLSSLKLSDLPHLTGFCKLEKGTEPMGVLFNTMISLPNLTSLVAERCKSLKHIFSPSMVKSLMQLKILKIRACELVEEIIQSKKMEEIEEEEEEDRAEAVVFPKLDYILLGSLAHVKWFSFGSSIKFPSLRELRIHHCSAMRNFVGRDSISESTEEYFFNEMVSFSNLEAMRIAGMNNIKYLWDERFVADDSFCKLKHVDVADCSKLSVVFPSNICTRFQRLETLSLFRCGGVEHIYSGIDLKEVNHPFSLRELRLDHLRSLKHIWNMKSEWNKGSFSTFQNLQSVEVEGCDHLKWVFPASVGCGLPQLHQFQLARCDQLKVIIAKAKDDEGGLNASFQFPELKEMELMHMKEMRSLCEGGGSHSFNCPNLKSLKVLGCSNISLAKFLSNVEELMVDEQGFNAIHGYADVSAGFYSKLKKITLCSLNEETSIAAIFSVLNQHKYLEMLVFTSSSVEEISRLHDPLDQRPTGEEQHHCLRVKHLKLEYIEKLNYITKEDSQFNHNLQTLHLKSCHDLMSITPSSICLQNLTTLHVEYTDKMKYLVTASTAKTMVHLIEMKVVWCERVEEIVAKDGGETEHDVMLIFNKLQRLELSRLPNLDCFCSDKDTLSFPLLEQVTIQKCPRMKIFCGGVVCTPKLQGILFENEQQWEGNLNATITSQLRSWVGEHLEDGGRFHNLESLQVVNGTIASKAVLLANQMCLLNKLREITVRDCDSIQVVFDLEGLYTTVEGYIGLLPELKKLKLVNLPVMTQLCNKAPKGILDFNKLQMLKIDNCRKLPYVFTWSMASCLSQLEWVEVKNCEMMETFIMDEEHVTTKVTFNALENVVLESMPKFSCIYSGSGDLECPSLKWVTIRECPSINPMLISTQVHSTKQVFPKSVVLSIDMKSVRGMMRFEAHSDLFRILKLGHWSSMTTSHALLVRFLSRLPNLGQLELCDSSCQEFLLFQSGSLVNSASSTASFQNLVTLAVSECNQLMNAMTPSMARSLVQLKHLKIEDCKMLMEIAGDGSDEAADDVIFTKLETLELIDLLSLNAFSLTHHNFDFPCLDSVTLERCPNLRIFCNGSVSTAMLNCVLDREYCGIHYWEGNLNTTTEHLYRKMVGFRGVEEIKLSAFPVLKEKWDSWFPTDFLTSLVRLEVDNCELFSNAVASRLLKHLECLKVLVVENCNSVEQVIDLEGLNAGECGNNQVRNLEELQLIDLPKLKQVWSKDPHQILSFENLQTLKVDNCGSLTFIFNLSMALSLPNLQHVEVKNCRLVEHIIMISEEETVQQYQTVLPSLRSLTLLHLSNLFRFCSTSGVVKCPSLKMIGVVDCPNVEVFASTFSEGQHLSITFEDPDSKSAFLGNKIVMPGLEELKVEWKDLKDQLFGNYGSRFLSKLKCIELTSFQCGEDANFPPNFLGNFLSLENLYLSDSIIEEIIFDNLSIQSLVLLTKLKLSNLPKLKHLVREDCQPFPLVENLVDLEVVECSSLKILAPSNVSFLNLTDLQVSKCDRLINLLSPSAARSLV